MAYVDVHPHATPTTSNMNPATSWQVPLSSPLPVFPSTVYINDNPGSPIHTIPRSDSLHTSHSAQKRVYPRDPLSDVSFTSYGKIRVLENQMANMGLYPSPQTITTPEPSPQPDAYSATEGYASRLQAMWNGRPMGPSVLQPISTYLPTFVPPSSAQDAVSSTVQSPYNFGASETDLERQAQWKMTPNYFVDEPISDDGESVTSNIPPSRRRPLIVPCDVDGNELVSSPEYEPPVTFASTTWQPRDVSIDEAEEDDDDKSEDEYVGNIYLDLGEETGRLALSDFIRQTLLNSAQHGSKVLPESILKALRPSPSPHLAIVPFVPNEEILKKHFSCCSPDEASSSCPQAKEGQDSAPLSRNSSISNDMDVMEAEPLDTRFVPVPDVEMD